MHTGAPSPASRAAAVCGTERELPGLPRPGEVGEAGRAAQRASTKAFKTGCKTGYSNNIWTFVD